MRVVETEAEIDAAYLGASREAGANFGDGSVYVEKYLERLRHVEVQVLADSYGETVTFPERDCSVQRRYQKLIEESPAPDLPEGVREGLMAASAELVGSLDYEGAGTVEFVYADGEFYFIEMNTRLQVEHPVTEMISGVDIVAEQLKVVSGERLVVPKDALSPDGHAIEFRINAEDPPQLLAPGWAGRGLQSARRTRRQSRLAPLRRLQGAPYYDSLLAKLIVHARDREASIRRGLRALDEFAVSGMETTLPLHLAVLEDEEFRRGGVTTRFLADRELESEGGLLRLTRT